MPLATRLLLGSHPKPIDWASMNPFSSAQPPTPTSARPRTPYRSRTFPPSGTGRVETRAPTPHSPMTTIFHRDTAPSTPRGTFNLADDGRSRRRMPWEKKKRPPTVPRRAWKGDLYDCFEPFDCSNCMLATCCPCILYARNKQRFDHLTLQGYPHPDLAATRRTKPALHKARQQEEEDDQHQGCLCSSSDEPVRHPPPRVQPRQDPSLHRHSQDQHHHDDDDHTLHNETDGDSPSRSLFAQLFSIPCLSHALGAPLGVGVVLQAMNRWTMREQYNIKGERWHDGCTALFCGPCALLQEAHELKEEEEAFILDSIDVREPRYF